MPLPSALPTPVEIPPAHIVRVRLGGHCYHSPFLAPSEAKATAAKLLGACSSRHEGFVDFDTADGRTVSIRSRAISAIEVGPPPAHWRDRLGKLDEPVPFVPTEPDPDLPDAPEVPVPGPWAQAKAKAVERAARPTPADVYGPRRVQDSPQA